jgi:hypothetical protein
LPTSVHWIGIYASILRISTNRSFLLGTCSPYSQQGPFEAESDALLEYLVDEKTSQILDSDTVATDARVNFLMTGKTQGDQVFHIIGTKGTPQTDMMDL